ncbi:ATP-binding protein [Mastigocoleus testarum]|uniref:histidine kinase n=1 Tax=Mastigocoleus testarum BC008 TaxID=371196 RepID=A0A0V7ZQA7_9CYAN|nr:ATP-binding protein [Mastigocoleus testarum]KST66593.1 histidine kinase [Mastigocoleus testarum BC008]
MLLGKYSKLPLKIKIILPLLSVLIIIWALATITFGYFFSYNLESKLRSETEEVSSTVLESFERRKQLLFLKARWIAESTEVSQLVNKGDKLALTRYLLPLKESLQLDLIKIIDKNGVVLAYVRQGEIKQAKLNNQFLDEAASIGMDIFDVVTVSKNKHSVLVALTSVKSREEILGGVIIGKTINDKILAEIRAQTQPHLVILHDQKVTASTLEIAKENNWQLPPIKSRPILVNIGNKEFIAKSINVIGLNGNKAKIVLLNSVTPLRENQQQLWIYIIIFSVIGTTIFSITVTKLTNLVTRRIIYLNNATQKLAGGDFSARIKITDNDEISILAKSFNYMAEQVSLLLDKQKEANKKLEEYNQNLENTVQNRTYELKQKNSELKNILQELQRTQAQMIQGEKMSSLGQMIAGIAHEINNPVSFVYGNIVPAINYAKDLLNLIELYQKHYPEPDQEIQDEIQAIDLDYVRNDFMKLLNSMAIGSERIHKIVLSLRNFSRLDEDGFKRVDIHEGIDNTLMILQNRLKLQSDHPEIKIVKEYSSLPLVDCYPGQLNQVFMNLFVNAIDALDEYNLQRTPEEIKANASYIKISTEVNNDEWVMIRITDNGPGISDKIKPKLFDPFFTTKEVGKGTGLGLSISYQIIVDKHSGKLNCYSKEGKGTEFVVEIPINQ